MVATVTTWYLGLAPEQFSPAARDIAGFEVKKVEIPSAEYLHFLYRAVGGNWFWHMKAQWTFAQWQAEANRPNLHTWVGYQSGTPAGYFQLLSGEDHTANLQYFGFLPQFIGKGWGSHLLSVAVGQAFAMGAKNLTVNTCTLDHPRALTSYQARGFRIYKTETFEVDLPRRTPGPWNGAFEDVED
jgi:ribosomal protein S18 acetylase RimI-like enzyme